MIHLALWLISAVVVIFFILMGLGLATAVLSNGRWVYALMILGVLGIWIWQTTDKQNREWEQKKANNTPLYAQCVDNVYQNKMTLYNRAYAARTAMQQYINQLNNAEQSAISNCNFKYPH